MKLKYQKQCDKIYHKELLDDISHMQLSIDDIYFRKNASQFIMKREEVLGSENVFLIKFKDTLVNKLPNWFE